MGTPNYWAGPGRPPFFRREFIFSFLGRINFITLCAREKEPPRGLPMSLTHKIETALSPDLTPVQTHWLLCLLWQKNHGLLRELPCDRQTVLLFPFTRPRWIPKCPNRIKLGHQQVVHIPSLFASSNTTKTVVLGFPQFKPVAQVHSKSAYPVIHRDASLIRHRTSQPTPIFEQSTKAYFMWFQPLHSMQKVL
jgi:hypothetical protein